MVLVLGIVEASLEILGIGIGVNKMVLLRCGPYYTYVLLLLNLCSQFLHLPLLWTTMQRRKICFEIYPWWCCFENSDQPWSQKMHQYWKCILPMYTCGDAHWCTVIVSLIQRNKSKILTHSDFWKSMFQLYCKGVKSLKLDDPFLSWKNHLQHHPIDK